MSDPPVQQDTKKVPAENAHEKVAKKRPKITFINPAEWAELDAKPSGTSTNQPDNNLYQRFIDRQVNVAQEEGMLYILKQYFCIFF